MASKLNITFHSPNSKEESRLIAEDFISHAARSVVKSFILDKGETQKGENNATDMGDLRNLRKR